MLTFASSKGKMLNLKVAERGDVKKRIMSRTRNRMLIAKGTIAENARRQMSMMNQCRMPRGMKRDWRFMGHMI